MNRVTRVFLDILYDMCDMFFCQMGQVDFLQMGRPIWQTCAVPFDNTWSNFDCVNSHLLVNWPIIS